MLLDRMSSFLATAGGPQQISKPHSTEARRRNRDEADKSQWASAVGPPPLRQFSVFALHLILHGDLVMPDAPVELSQQSRSFNGDN
jgi:hypothetical protein